MTKNKVILTGLLFFHQLNPAGDEILGVGIKNNFVVGSMTLLHNIANHFRRWTASFQYANWFPIFKSDRELIECANSAATDQDRVRCPREQKVAAGVTETGINNEIEIIEWQLVEFNVLAFG